MLATGWKISDQSRIAPPVEQLTAVGVDIESRRYVERRLHLVAHHRIQQLPEPRIGHAVSNRVVAGKAAKVGQR